MPNESKLSDAQKLGKAKEILETRLSAIHAAFDSMIGLRRYLAHCFAPAKFGCK